MNRFFANRTAWMRIFAMSATVVLALSIAAHGQTFATSPSVEAVQPSKPAGGMPIHVQFDCVELSVTKLTKLGMDVSCVSSLAQGASPQLFVPWQPGKPQPTAGKGFQFQVFDDANMVRGLFDALCHDKLAKMRGGLALVAINGQTASFCAGDKISIPQPQKDGTTAVAYKRYGTEIELTPKVQEDGVIQLVFSLRLSHLDAKRVVHVGQDTVPAIEELSLATTLQLKNGQTCLLPGPIRAREVEKVWSDASATDGQGTAAPPRVTTELEETQLVVLVTAETVPPAAVQSQVAPPARMAAQPVNGESQTK